MKLRLTLLLFILAVGARADNDAIERCHEAARVLEEIMGVPEQGIPSELLLKAHCVGIIPSMKRGGFIFGGRYGKGVFQCRGEGGKGWTGPHTVRIEGGSIGLQIGGSAVDLVLLVMNERGKEKLIASKFTLGGDASVAGGPVGRTAAAQTDAQMSAEILSYSRSRGVFAGVSLQGSTLRQDASDNRKIYGKNVTPEEILNGKVSPPASVQLLIDTLNKYSSVEHK